MSLTPHELELMLLSMFVRVERDARDRSLTEVVPVHHATGLPESTKDMLPRAQMRTGTELALSFVIVPEQLAAAFFRREIEGKQVALATLERGEWTDDEAFWVAWLAREIKLTAHRMTEREGTFRLEVADFGCGEGQLELDCETNLTRAFQITYEGLKAARKRVRGTRYEFGPVSIKDDVMDAVWHTAPTWARSEASRG